MKIIISYLSDQENDEYTLPEGIEGTIHIEHGEGLDGNVVLVIIQIAEKALSSAADIATIAAFIYMIIHNKRDARAVVEKKAIPEPLTPASITEQLTQKLED